MSETSCLMFYHWSTLKFKTKDIYDGYMYVCVATENNEDKIHVNMTIRTKEGNILCMLFIKLGTGDMHLIVYFGEFLFVACGVTACVYTLLCGPVLSFEIAVMICGFGIVTFSFRIHLAAS